MRRFACVLIAVVALVSVMTSQAEAISQFRKAFQQKYVDPSDNAAFKEAFKKASCNTCHVKGEKKNVHNDYGVELSKLIEGNANQRIRDAGKEGGSAGRKAETEKVLKELEKAFEIVAKKESKNGRPYGEIIQSGQLPAAE